MPAKPSPVDVTYERILEELYDRAKASLDDVLNLCESEIEKLFVLGCLDTAEMFLNDNAMALNEPILVGCWGSLYAQVQIGKHRVDFVLDTAPSYQPHARKLGQRWVIECDGHDFHERTKEQAGRDKRRDRDLAAAGHHVLRFTGSEIWRDAKSCGYQLHKTVVEAEHARFQQANPPESPK